VEEMRRYIQIRKIQTKSLLKIRRKNQTKPLSKNRGKKSIQISPEFDKHVAKIWERIIFPRALMFLKKNMLDNYIINFTTIYIQEYYLSLSITSISTT
jgi:hypothetical protein